MTKGKTTRIQSFKKGTGPNNNRPITSLLKILTAEIREEIYYSLMNQDCSLKNRKNATREHEEKDSYYTMINTSSRRKKNRRKNIAITRTDYQRAYDIFIQSWIIDCFKMYSISWTSHKVNRENNEKLKVGIDRRKKKFTSGENLTITICDS